MMYGVPGMVAQRLMQLVPVMIVATFVVFSLVYMMPGDPAMMIAGDYATAERIAEIRHIYGFDRPMLVQYFFWLGNAVQGDLGHSLFSNDRSCG